MNELHLIEQAVKLLNQGSVIAMPTETVYGLAADAANPIALRKIFAIKNRPSDHPLIVHIGDVSQLSLWSREVSENALLCAQYFWPGPLTLILKKNALVNDMVTGGQDTVGLRIPNHPVALLLLKKFGRGLAAPSANKFGSISPTTADAVFQELNNEVDLILDGGPCDVGLESTILDLSSDLPAILRPGVISAQEIERVLKRSVLTTAKNSPRVSGSLEKHYAPKTPAFLCQAEDLDSLSFKASSKNQYGFIIFSDEFYKKSNKFTQSLQVQNNFTIKKLSNNPVEYGHDLYQSLRELDCLKLEKIFIEDVPATIEWLAVKDRLKRLSA